MHITLKKRYYFLCMQLYHSSHNRSMLGLDFASIIFLHGRGKPSHYYKRL